MHCLLATPIHKDALMNLSYFWNLNIHGFKNAANITLGLPFIRTSVDHGTALDLAGTGKIDLGSFKCALSFFEKISKNGSYA